MVGFTLPFGSNVDVAGAALLFVLLSVAVVATTAVDPASLELAPLEPDDGVPAPSSDGASFLPLLQQSGRHLPA